MTGASLASGRWRSHAFGLALDSSFPLVGCPESDVPNGLPRVSMDLSGRAVLRRSLPPNCAPVSWYHDEAGAQVPGFTGHPRAGYLVDASGFGMFHLSRGGRHVRCAAARAEAWRWQRYLIGQVLPFACTLRGFEPWHASAVAVRSGVVALVGNSGLGKSSLAAHLILGGARLMADDVIALEATAAGVVVHPGPGLMSIRRATVERLDSEQLRTLGSRVGGDERSMRLAVARHDGPVPLQAVYLLEESRTCKRATLDPEPAPDPRRLLGSTFNFALTSPRRLIRQLEVCATVARSVRVVRVRVPPDTDHRALAQLLLADAGEAGR